MENRKAVIDEETIQILEKLKPLFKRAERQSAIEKIKVGFKELINILF
ncbi:hypothetical protein KQI36_14325 [Clostridium senegalense]|nr:hypothetical protein [Clostridium senegalense]MBU5227809.1 hypothetical protein [Clostridium senegalense]